MSARKLLLCAVILAAASTAGPRKLKPGFNLFSKQQDVQLGKEAAAQVERQAVVVNDAQLNVWLRRVGEKLATTEEAGGYPYTFQLVSDKSINAFALPGGPTFVHTGLLASADNEAQVAGVLAHEISHVALRHGTNQASKANLIQLPAALAGAVAGQGSMLGNLAQLGIGVGAGSVLLKFSRDAERDADLLGTRIMAKAGYNPVELARFFEKLEAEGGARGPQFLSDHPNPGNRRKAIEAEIRTLPRRDYTLGDAQQFARMQHAVAALPPPPPKKQAAAGGPAPAVPSVQPSTRLREHRNAAYSLTFPDDWQIQADPQSLAATVAPPDGIVGNAIGIGFVAGFHKPANGAAGLRQDTDDLLRQLSASNAGMTVRTSGDTDLGGQPARIVRLQSRSPYAGAAEVDTLVSVQRPQGLFYLVWIAPEPALANLQPTFDAILRSVRFLP
jgi:Zn-dependent protease with chaperone function